jgi:hypothetical protein
MNEIRSCSGCMTVNACYFGWCCQLPNDDPDVPEVITPEITGKGGMDVNYDQDTTKGAVQGLSLFRGG